MKKQYVKLILVCIVMVLSIYLLINIINYKILTHTNNNDVVERVFVKYNFQVTNGVVLSLNDEIEFIDEYYVNKVINEYRFEIGCEISDKLRANTIQYIMDNHTYLKKNNLYTYKVIIDRLN